MKTWILLAALAVPALSSAQETFVLKGRAGNLNAPAKVYLDCRINGETIEDSAILKNGVFEFKGVVHVPALARIVIDHTGEGMMPANGEQDRLLFYLEKGNITLTTDKLISNAVITGSPLNKEYDRYKKYISAYDTAMAALNRVYGASTEAQRYDTSFMAGLDRQFRAAIAEKKRLQKKFILANPDSYFSVVALKELGVMNNMNIPELEPLFNGLTARLKASPVGEEFKTSMETELKLGVGGTAPDFTQNDVNDKPVKLSDFKGKYVLLDFWASWCAPCRAENPFVVAAEKNFKAKGFTVLSVSLDQPGKKELWLKAIEKDGLEAFTHVSDLQYWDNAVAKKYGVRGVPTNYLIDPNGKIIAKNLRGENLEKQLTVLIK